MNSLLLSPLLPLPILLAIGAFLVLAAVLCVWRSRSSAFLWHLAPGFFILLALANPRITSETATPLDDVAVIVVDESRSMSVGARREQTEKALAQLQERLGALDGLDLRIVRYKSAEGLDEGTKLFGALDGAMQDIPGRRLAAAVFLTDGQIADIPPRYNQDAPLHVLISGSRNERDRRLSVESAAAFGLVGDKAQVTFKIEDPGYQGMIAVTLTKDGGEPISMDVVANSSKTIDIPIDHAGANIIEIEAAAAANELTLQNNRTALSISGVRDRMRVLLISGAPHAGERMWRNLLKADPSVDLVHFTILRSPEKADYTPLRELALIPFPVQELFEEKINDFDLIILDRFQRRSLLPPAYFDSMARYVEGGGALLVVAGEEFADKDSPFDGALAQIMPALPTGKVVEQPFRPTITEIGKRHPVTAGLPGGQSDPPEWGRWMRQLGGVVRQNAITVMQSDNGSPLLVLGQSGEGRVAQLLSDHVWLWGRGYEGGGPQAELLRRLAHWMMKEPELEAERLSVDVRNDRLEIRRQSLSPVSTPVEVTAPDGTKQLVDLKEQGNGVAIGSVLVDQQGLWRVRDDGRVVLAASGAVNPVEMAALRAVGDKVAPIVQKSGGGLAWIEDGLPEMRRVRPGGRMAGDSWFGFRANKERIIASLKDDALIPAPLMLFLVLGSMIVAWLRQGKL